MKGLVLRSWARLGEVRCFVPWFCQAWRCPAWKCKLLHGAYGGVLLGRVEPCDVLYGEAFHGEPLHGGVRIGHVRSSIVMKGKVRHFLVWRCKERWSTVMYGAPKRGGVQTKVK